MPGAIALIGVGIALAVGAWASYADRAAMLILAIAAAGCAILGLMGLLRRPRLTLGPGPELRAATMRGPLSLVPAETESIELLGTRRLAFRSEQLLIEATEGRLLVFGRWDLGENPRRVFEALADAGFPVSDRTRGDS